MRKMYKIKSLKLSKAFLGAAAIGIVPAALQLFPAVMTAIANGGGIQGVIVASLFCLLTPITIGIIGVVLCASYNWLSPKIGQFEIELEEVENLF